MKLTKNQKEILKDWRAVAGLGNVDVFHVEGLFTVAWQREFPKSKMVSVAVSYFDQSEKDKFRCKTGEYFALQRILTGISIKVPLGHMEDDEIVDTLARMLDL